MILNHKQIALSTPLLVADACFFLTGKQGRCIECHCW